MKLTVENVVIFDQMKQKLVVFHLRNAVELVTIHADHLLNERITEGIRRTIRWQENTVSQ